MISQPNRHTRVSARAAGAKERVVVVSEDPGFWLGLRRERPELEGSWVLAQSARECLVAVEGPHVKLVVLDGALHDKPALQLLRLIKQIRPQLQIVFASQKPDDEWERGAREAGVLFYGDRTQLGDMARVIRQSIPESTRSHPQRRSLSPEVSTKYTQPGPVRYGAAAAARPIEPAGAEHRDLMSDGGGVRMEQQVKKKTKTKGNVEIRVDECKGCAYCVEVCPQGVLKLSEGLNRKGYHPTEYAGEGCTACGICFYTCPEPGAIRITKLDAES